MNKQQLAAKIWESANKMRSKIEANEYKDYILGFIFYKFLCERQTKILTELGFTQDDLNSLTEEHQHYNFAKENVGYFIASDNLFSTWISLGKNFDVSNVTDALNAFSRLIHTTHKKLFDGIFKTLQTGLSKLGDSSGSRTKAISDLLDLIKDIPMDGKQDYDVLGFIYEYLIGMFAANAGKKAGEFYTPHEVSVLMSEIIAEHTKNKDEITIYDPTSGSGSLLINIGSSISKTIGGEDNIKYYAQELKENTYNLTRMNLVMRGISPNNIVTRNADTLEDDWPYFDESDPANTYNPLYVDAVVSNPPYSQAWDRASKEHDPRYARFGLAPKTKADYAFLLHDLYHIKPDGIMTIVLPHGVLFRGGEEGQIRKNLIEFNNIDTIIGLPANIFFGTGIPTIIIVLKQKRKNSDVLIIDASKGFVKEGKNNKLRASDIKKIVDTVNARQSIEGYSSLVTREEIRENDYNLNIPRYVDSSNSHETWDIYATMFGGLPLAEIDALKDYWATFPNLKKSLFTEINDAYVSLSTEDLKKAITEHKDILSYKNTFEKAFTAFEDYLQAELIQKAESLEIAKQEAVLSDDIFNRLQNIPLVDKYHAYQLLDDKWASISVDLEIIQTEGFSATKQVNPNMVIKKKNGKDVEVQEGWIGHIIPFDLVQKSLLITEYNELKQKENELLNIASEYEEIIDSLSEEEKEDCLNEAKDAFSFKDVAKKIKDITGDISEDDKAFKQKLQKVEELSKKEKELKKEIKEKESALHILTKKTIENLSDEEVKNLLHKKWIEPLAQTIFNIPSTVIQNLVSLLQAIIKKYESSLLDIETSMSQTEKELCSMIDDLTGSEFDLKGLAELQKLLGGEA